MVLAQVARHVQDSGPDKRKPGAEARLAWSRGRTTRRSVREAQGPLASRSSWPGSSHAGCGACALSLRVWSGLQAASTPPQGSLKAGAAGRAGNWKVSPALLFLPAQGNFTDGRKRSPLGLGRPARVCGGRVSGHRPPAPSFCAVVRRQGCGCPCPGISAAGPGSGRPACAPATRPKGARSRRPRPGSSHPARAGRRPRARG